MSASCRFFSITGRQFVSNQMTAISRNSVSISTAGCVTSCCRFFSICGVVSFVSVHVPSASVSIKSAMINQHFQTAGCPFPFTAASRTSTGVVLKSAFIYVSKSVSC
jgi:hypothetical protein